MRLEADGSVRKCRPCAGVCFRPRARSCATAGRFSCRSAPPCWTCSPRSASGARASCGKEAPFRRRRDPGRWSCSWEAERCAATGISVSETLENPSHNGKKSPAEPVDGKPATVAAQNARKIPFRLKQLHLPKSHRGSWDASEYQPARSHWRMIAIIRQGEGALATVRLQQTDPPKGTGQAHRISVQENGSV